MSERPNHAYTITLRPSAAAFDAELLLPPGAHRIETVTWVPGAYGFMRYGRDVVGVSAEAGDGHALSVKREGFTAFRVEKSSGPVVVRWSAMACEAAWGELAGYVASDHAVFLGTRCLFEPNLEGPVDVSYVVPPHWKLYHPAGGERVGEPHVFRYPSFAAFLDTPVVCGDFVFRARELAGKTFHFVFVDRAVGMDDELDGFVDDVMAIAEQCLMVFGSFPFDSYTFVASFDPRAHWGLEHANATMIGIGPLALVDPEARLAALRVAAHELVHAWNVCRLRPAAFVAPDFAHGSFPEELWVAEGFTRYYEFLLLSRAGLIAPNRVVSNIVNYWRAIVARPSYKRVSLTDSSAATFLNHHRYPGAINTTIDYYDGGMLAAFDLDVALRVPPSGVSSAHASLDHAFRAFYDAFEPSASGYTQADVRDFFEASQPGLGEVVRRETEGKGELSVPAALARLGVVLAFHDVPYIGVILKEDRVADVLDDGPAARAGIHSDDRIVSVDGLAFSSTAFRWLVGRRSSLVLSVRRGDRFLEITVTVGSRPDVASARFVGGEPEMTRIRAWLGQDLTPGPNGELPLTAYDNFHGTDPVS